MAFKYDFGNKSAYRFVNEKNDGAMDTEADGNCLAKKSICIY